MLQILCSSNNIDIVKLRHIWSLSRYSKLSNRQTILLLNHDLRSTNTTIVLKAQDDSSQSSGHFRGCGQKQEHDFRRDVGKSNQSN